jgi:hypothetical protein
MFQSWRVETRWFQAVGQLNWMQLVQPPATGSSARNTHAICRWPLRRSPSATVRAPLASLIPM